MGYRSPHDGAETLRGQGAGLGWWEMLACSIWDTHRELSLEFLGERATIGAVGGQAGGPLESAHVHYLSPLPGPSWLCWKGLEEERKRGKRRTLHIFQVAISCRGI